MGDIVFLPPRNPDAVKRQPEHIRRADETARPLSNLRLPSAVVAASALAEWAEHQGVSVSGTVHSQSLAEALGRVTPNDAGPLGGDVA